MRKESLFLYFFYFPIEILNDICVVDNFSDFNRKEKKTVNLS